MTSYRWNAWDKLVGVQIPDGKAFTYSYDYRSRRVATAQDDTGGLASKHTAVVFSGGLSVAEFERSSNSTINSSTQPTVQYGRGPDMGGGVGGLLYSLRSSTVKYNLSNGRGDVVAQSDGSGALTWTASYEAFGKRTKETGTNADKQRANSKDEDPTGLLNEGFRYRDLETGVWLSRDPAGFVDGPNLYAYVKQNPWTKFDPLGLYEDCGDGSRIGVDKDGYHRVIAGNNYPNHLYRYAAEVVLNQDNPTHLKRAADRYENVLVKARCEGFARTIIWEVENPEAAQKKWDAIGVVAMAFVGTSGYLSRAGTPKLNLAQRPGNRADIHTDLREKGYTYVSTSPNGYVTYKGPDGRKMTIKPSGEVIPTQKVWNEDKTKKYSERQNYEGKRLPDQSHSTDHKVEPIEKVQSKKVESTKKEQQMTE